MALRSTFGRVCLLVALTASYVRASGTLPDRLYEIITETGMPHLEENLRYAVTQEKRCLADQDLSSAFPILRDVSLADCKLQHESRQDDTISYLLVCEGGHGTTGSATWRMGEHLIRGTLNVKLGGKNMTFYQRVTAKALRVCPSGGMNSN